MTSLGSSLSNGASVSITPEVEMQMGLGSAADRRSSRRGAAMNIGTDVVTGVSTDMFTQMRFLLQTQRALTNDNFHRGRPCLTGWPSRRGQALEFATIKSAQCFGLDDRIGSLAPGKEADIVLLRKTDINMRAAADPISAIVLHAGVANVDTVIVGGNVVKQNGKLAHRDLQQRFLELENSSRRLYEGFASNASAA